MLTTENTGGEFVPLQPPKPAKSVKSFCRDWEMGRTKFYELLKEGKLRAVKFGGRTRVLAEDEARFAQSLPQLK